MTFKPIEPEEARFEVASQMARFWPVAYAAVRSQAALVSERRGWDRQEVEDVVMGIVWSVLKMERRRGDG